MTEQVQTVASSEPAAVTSAPTSTVSTTSAAPVVSSAESEKLIPQSQVDGIVKERMGHADKKAYERGKAEALAEYQLMQANIQQPYAAQMPQTQAPMQTQGQQAQYAPQMQQPIGQMPLTQNPQDLQRLIDEGV